MKIGYIVGRFQTNKLHKGYEFLINEILKDCDHFAIVLGTSSLPPNRRNPFSTGERQLILIQEIIKRDLIDRFAGFIEVMDMKDDRKWSQQLDEKINNVDSLTLLTERPANEAIKSTLYGSRDCFASYYSGTTPIKVIDSPIPDYSSTQAREKLLNRAKKFRRRLPDSYLIGKLKAIHDQYPKTYPTVDVAILNDHGEILLGRKHAESQFRFPGGFVDPTDLSYEAAAKREALEECGSIELDDFRYVSSMLVDDWRYRAQVDKIMTTLFQCKYIYGQPKGSDDLAEVKWVKLKEVTEDMIVGEHWKLFNILLKKNSERGFD